jgi:long-subunit acyl-CoA synthetase (AMP-forming)
MIRGPRGNAQRGPELFEGVDPVLLGYWNQPEATRRAIRGDGDAGYLDADGYIYIYDRVKDMIKVDAGFPKRSCSTEK